MSRYDVEIKDGTHTDKSILKEVSWGEVLDYVKNVKPEILHGHHHPCIEISESYSSLND